jgi:hypothetical protein
MQRTGGDASTTYQLTDNSQTSSQMTTTGDNVTTTSNSTERDRPPLIKTPDPFLFSHNKVLN